jgi:hypothetical protein
MTLPKRSLGHYSQWTTLSPTVDYALGTLSPEGIDQDIGPNPSVLRLTEGGVTSVSCSLKVELFEDGISNEQGGRPAWTLTQRNKAHGCEALGTIDELLTWVSRLNQLLSIVLTIYCEQLNGLPSSGKARNRIFKRIDSTFNAGFVFVLHSSNIILF